MDRCFACVLFLLASTYAAWGQAVLINEVMAANRTSTVGPSGDHPDWVELFNAGSRTADLGGMRLVRDGRQFRLPEGTRLAPRKHVVYWCGNGPGELPFAMPRAGSTLLLINADGTTILDVFTFPDLPADVSFGRLPDGAPTWSYFMDPGPGSASPELPAIRDITPAPTASLPAGRYSRAPAIALLADASSTIRYTLDGSRPTREHGLTYSDSIPLEHNTVLRAMAFRPGSLDSDVFCATYLIGVDHPGPALSLVMDPADLHSDPSGIDTEGSYANFSRSGRSWERPVDVWMEGDPAPMHAGIRIAGSGSRSVEKRSYKVLLRPRFDSPDSGFSWSPQAGMDECMLRAGPFPHAYLRNTCMEAVVKRSGMAVDVQPGIPVMLYLNGQAHGLYRAMAPKDEQWVRSLSSAEAVDLLEGPASVAMAGDRAHYEQSIQLLLDGAAVDRIEAAIDVNSLLDLACTDVYTGRADHDINVRCWRPKSPDGRWRWILYDQDIWAPVSDNSVGRMCSSSVPETPFLKEILRHETLRSRFLARYAVLMHTAFSPEAMTSVVDSIYTADRERMEADQQRWGGTLDLPSPAESAREMRLRAEQRPQLTLDQLARHTGVALHHVTVTVSPKEGGTIRVDGFTAGERFEGDCFAHAPLRITAEAAPGMEFAGWKGTDHSGAEISVDPAQERKLKAVFRPIGSGRHLP